MKNKRALKYRKNMWFETIVYLGDTSLVNLVSKQAKKCNTQNEQDSEGNTALHLAVYVYRELSEQAIAQTVVELLLKNGVNPLLENHGKNTARSCIANTNKELSKILLEYESMILNLDCWRQCLK